VQRGKSSLIHSFSTQAASARCLLVMCDCDSSFTELPEVLTHQLYNAVPMGQPSNRAKGVPNMGVRCRNRRVVGDAHLLKTSCYNQMSLPTP
jgi:hypothetical protein